MATEAGQRSGRTFFGQPPVLANLFGVELWERFSFYGMQGILLIYLYYSAGEGGLGIAEGTATSIVGAYGGLVEKTVEGEYIVDTGHLVAYDPNMKLKVQLAGGLLSSFFGGEGLVTRVEGNGRIILQSRSLSGLAGWLNPKL